MSVDRLINLLASITLVEMMFTIGLGVTLAEIGAVARDWRLIVPAMVSNYFVVPAAALGLIFLFQPQPMVAAGFLIVATCPGAPYGPPFNSVAKGDVAVAVGLMAVLAGSSALLAPVILQLLLPLVAGDQPLAIDGMRMVVSLVITQFLPLCAGLAVKFFRPAIAAKFKVPAGKVSLAFNLALLGLVLVTQFRMLIDIPLRGYGGMLALVAASFLGGLMMAGPDPRARKTMAISTSTRNVGVALVIAASSFSGTPAIGAVTAYALFQTLLIALVAYAWGRLTPGKPGISNQPLTPAPS